MKSDIYLESKPRYEILDGLRGVAAILLVVFHLLQTYFHDGHNNPVNHGYMAVDFFFVLSGFVIGYAYDDRWDRMTTWSFFKRRLIRLHPMVIFGTLLGALLFYFGDCPVFPLIKDSSVWKVIVCMLLGFTMIPIGRGMDIRGWGETYPLNGPIWSLQWEYLANILYALFFRRLGKVALAFCVALFAALTVILCLNIDLLGVLGARSNDSYTVVGGVGLTPDQLQIGFTRLLYPFFCGLLLSRMGWLIKLRGGFWWCSLLVAGLMCMPWMGLSADGDGRWTNGLYECVCILVAFPLIVSIGAGSSVKGGKTEAINKFLGKISYPIYITHYPLVYVQISWAYNHADAPLGQHIFVSVGTFIMAIGVAYAAYRLYDLSVREWLKRKWFSNQPK